MGQVETRAAFREMLNFRICPRAFLMQETVNFMAVTKANFTFY